MSKHVYCEKCLDVIEDYEDLVVLNGKPYHYHCYEKELNEEKKKTLVERFTTWRFLNSGLIANIQALIVIIASVYIYISGNQFIDSFHSRFLAVFLITLTIISRLYGFLFFEINAKKGKRKSRILQSKEAVLQIVKIETIDMLKVAGTVLGIAAIWSIISTTLM